MGASHLSCLSNSQHYLQGLHKVSNSLAQSTCECERYSVPSSIHQNNCICNTDFLWSIFPVTIFYSLSVMLFIERSVWQARSMYNAYFIQHSFALHHPHPCVLSHCPSYYYSVAFQDKYAQVFQIYSNRKLIDPHFQEKLWPISIDPCQYTKLQNAQIKLGFRQQLDACRQKHLWKAVLLFWD